jgi:hypothetical protein
MLKTLGWLAKLTLFTTAILAAGEWIRWDGQTLSRHVTHVIGQAASSDTFDRVRDLTSKATREITEDAKAGYDKTTKSLGHAKAIVVTDRTEMQAAAPNRATAKSEESLPSSERQKLKALIRELNGSGE